MSCSPSEVVVGVPCFNEAHRAGALAQALAALDPAPGAVLVVDDGSTDGTAEALEAVGLSVLRHPSNRGLGAARNTLWRAARDRGHRWIAYLDADVLPRPDHIARVAAAGSDGLGGPNIDVAPQGAVDAWRARFWPQSLGGSVLESAPMLVGAGAAYDLRALAAVGGFNERFRTHGEDVEVGRRLNRAGLRLRYDPSFVVEHHRHDGVRDLLRGCYLHCREGMRATREVPGPHPRPPELVAGMARKALWAPGAALVRRRDPAEAALGVAACGAGLLGYAVALAATRGMA